MSSESHDDENNQNDFDDIGYNVPKDHIVANREPMELPSSSSHFEKKEPPKDRQRASNFKYDYASDAVELSLKSNERRSK
jgi:hypothetical protein